MDMLSIVYRESPPAPWAEGEKIPWNDPDFSERMLREHLSQEHDAASRRLCIVDRQVAWIHESLLLRRPSRILDLGCGPGLYMHRLARLGHSCVGIDFGPSSIVYGSTEASRDGLDCRFIEGDVRDTEYGEGYDLAMMLYGEFNVFRPADAKKILQKAWDSLRRNGLLLLEVHTFEVVRQLGMAPRSWYSARAGLFSARPHLCLKESFWDADQGVAVERFYIVDAETGSISRHSASTKGYTAGDYRLILADTGYETIDCLESMGGAETIQEGLGVLVARKVE